MKRFVVPLALLAGCNIPSFPTTGGASGTCSFSSGAWECHGSYGTDGGIADATLESPAPPADAPLVAPDAASAADRTADVAIITDAPVASPDAPALGDAPVASPDVAPVPDARATAGMRVGTQLWQLGWLDSAQSFIPGVNFATATGVWQPALVTDLAGYTGPLRSMDAVATVNSSVAAWANRTAATAPLSAQTSDNGVAVEWWIDLCNRAHRDCWFNVPTHTAVGRAINDYAVAEATIVKAKLDPSLRSWWEYSNETWNGGPNGGPGINAAGYVIQQGKALGLPGSAGDGYEGGFRYSAIAAAGVFKAVESVFTGADRARIVKVMAGQRGNAWLVGVHLDTLAAEGVSADVYGVAPYLDGATIGDMQAGVVPLFRDEIKPIVDMAKARGVPTVCYEGGQEIYSNAQPANRDPGMFDVYTSYLDHADALGITHCALYLHVSPCTPGGCWGARESLTQPLAQSHKFRAVTAWMGAHP